MIFKVRPSPELPVTASTLQQHFIFIFYTYCQLVFKNVILFVNVWLFFAKYYFLIQEEVLR